MWDETYPADVLSTRFNEKRPPPWQSAVTHWLVIDEPALLQQVLDHGNHLGLIHLRGVDDGGVCGWCKRSDGSLAVTVVARTDFGK